MFTVKAITAALLTFGGYACAAAGMAHFFKTTQPVGNL